MIRFNIKNYDYVDSKISGEVRRFRINAPDEKSTFPAGKGKWGLLDWRGEELVGAIYDKINPFKEHLALTKKGKKYGYLDDKGRIAVDFIYENGTDFKNGVALVEKSGTSFYIDYLGEKIKKPKLKNEDENKAEIIPFRKDSPLWYKKTSNSFVSVLYFKEDEEDKPIKFKTKIAAEDNQKKTILQLFLICALAFENEPRPTMLGDIQEAKVVEIPNNLKTLNINLTELSKTVFDKSTIIALLKEDLTASVISDIKLSNLFNSIDNAIVDTASTLSRSLGLKQEDLKGVGQERAENLSKKLKEKYFWVKQGSGGSVVLMVSDKQLDNVSPQELSEFWIPQDTTVSYHFLKIPDHLVIFPQKQGS